MSPRPQGSGLILPGRTPEERAQNRLAGAEVPTEQWRAGAVAWTNLSYNSGWSTFSGTYPDAAFKLDSTGRLWLRGLVKNTAYSTATIATLPAGFRPGKNHHFTVVASGAYGQIQVETDGDIIHEAGATSYISLAQISFEASA